MENEKLSTTEMTLLELTSILENIDDPRLIADIAISAVMVLCKKLMTGTEE